jgi:hypothetical protein
MSSSMQKLGFRKHSTGVWPECVNRIRVELKAQGFQVRVVNSWKVGRKDIYAKVAAQSRCPPERM